MAEVPRRGPDAFLTSRPLVFKLASEYSPRGDQPQAIERPRGARRGAAAAHRAPRASPGQRQDLHDRQRDRQLNRPALVISPNKTLAAQLFSEFKAFFPENAVEYFVSYYDYYQPEAYIPQSDTYIEKDALVNDEIDRMRHSATTSLLERRDVVVVASVSCIYGIGAPETYHGHARGAAGGRDHRPRRHHPRGWSRCSTSATTTTSTGGPSGCAATWSRCSRPTTESEALRVELFGDTVERHPSTSIRCAGSDHRRG